MTGKRISVFVVAPILVVTGFYVASRSAMLFGYPFWILASCLWASTLAEILIRPFMGFLLPDARFGKPQPMYSMPEALRRQNKIQEAFNAYQKLAHDFPKELKPWVEMVRLAHLELQQDDLTKAVYHQGMKQLKNPAAREEFEKMFLAISSMSQKPTTAEERPRIAYPS